MTQAFATVTASPDEEVDTLSNFDRLRTHLITGSLAHALLDAWEGALPGTDKARAMMDALETFYTPDQQEDEQGATEEN